MYGRIDRIETFALGPYIQTIASRFGTTKCLNNATPAWGVYAHEPVLLCNIKHGKAEVYICTLNGHFIR